MKTKLPGIGALATNALCELYRFELADGSTWRFTTYSTDLIWQAQTYRADLLAITRGTVTSSAEEYGLTVQEADLTLYPFDFTAKFGGVSLAQFANDGGFDNAVVTIYRARKSYVVHLYEGLVTGATADRTHTELKLSDPKMLFNIDMPRNVFQAGCRHTLFDAGCSLAKASYRSRIGVGAGSSTRVIQCGLTQANDYFDGGELVFVNGVNAGVQRTVKNYSTGQIVLTLPLTSPAAVGDLFDVYPGCDGLRATCRDTFNNELNFGGQPYIPVPEQTV